MREVFQLIYTAADVIHTQDTRVTFIWHLGHDKIASVTVCATFTQNAAYKAQV